MKHSIRFQNILVASDFSPAADAALSEAAIIANSCNASITVANVVANPRGTLHSASLDAKLDLLYGEGNQFYQEVFAESESRLLRQIASIPAVNNPIRHKTLLGTPLVEVCRMVQHQSMDLVVLGKHSHSVWNSFFVGSTAKRIIRMCAAPVLVVGKEHARRPKHILVAVDFSDASRQACAVALQLAKTLAAEVDLLHVVDTRDVPPDLLTQIPLGFSLRKEMNEEAEQCLQNFVESLPVSGVRKAELAWGNPWKEITGAAERLKSDWVVTGTAGQTGAGAWLLGSTAEQVLTHCDCSQLVVKAPDFRCAIPLVDKSSSITDKATLIG